MTDTFESDVILTEIESSDGGRNVQPRLDLVSCYQQTEASRCRTSLDKFLKWKSQKQLRSKSI